MIKQWNFYRLASWGISPNSHKINQHAVFRDAHRKKKYQFFCITSLACWNVKLKIQDHFYHFWLTVFDGQSKMIVYILKYDKNNKKSQPWFKKLNILIFHFFNCWWTLHSICLTPLLRIGANRNSFFSI